MDATSRSRGVLLMLVGWLLFVVGVLAVLFALNALRPFYAPAPVAAVSFFAGWLAGELALHHAFVVSLAAAALVWGGALASWPGRVGAGLAGLAVILFWSLWRLGQKSRAAVAAALEDALPDGSDEDHDADDAPAAEPDPFPRWRQLLFPIPVTHPYVERTRDLVYFESGALRLKLDVFRRRGADHAPGARRPVLLFIHGGAWMIGSKDHHGLPVVQQLAARGWVCFSINYRLSPRATFPDHIVDVKRAIAWVRAHAAEYGGDPEFIVACGGSAGGHLAALAALSSGRPELQPGFESVDTSVAACVSFYGIYDFTDRWDHWHNPGLRRLLERYVLKARLDDARPAFAAASPMSYLTEDAPPFMLVHGEKDTLVPVAEGRAFFGELRAVSRAAAVYVELPGGQHAFEVFPSPRALHAIDGVERFARWVHAQHRAARAKSAVA